MTNHIIVKFAYKLRAKRNHAEKAAVRRCHLTHKFIAVGEAIHERGILLLDTKPVFWFANNNNIIVI